MTESTFYGDNTTVPEVTIDNSSAGQSAGWKLWKNLAAKSEVFGKPEKFSSHIEKSSWESATFNMSPICLYRKIERAVCQ